jgi:transposase-like protein
MRRYSEAVKADVRRRMSPPQRQSVAQISAELGIHVVTLYNWRKAWQSPGSRCASVDLASGLSSCPISQRRRVLFSNF